MMAHVVKDGGSWWVLAVLLVLMLLVGNMAFYDVESMEIVEV